MNRRQSRSTRSAVTRPAAALVATVLLLAACGGGGGGGNGVEIDHILHALVINASPEDVTVTYVGAESTDVALKTCSAERLEFPLADPFQLLIDGVAVIDTDFDLPDGIPNADAGYSDLIVQVTIDREGVASFDRVRPGSGLTKPSKASYCPTLPT